MGDTFNAKNSETITRKEVEATLRIQSAIITLGTYCGTRTEHETNIESYGSGALFPIVLQP
ncbi:AAEL013486-PA [Aedes aegypti]|uniref:AAEL013486-PA n=1 Tax=Aedes aegypti TaxID=7159 RepID=Q16J08_AEDAE|nr:AAEL013486-PA [Aedes aegypti]